MRLLVIFLCISNNIFSMHHNTSLTYNYTQAERWEFIEWRKAKSVAQTKQEYVDLRKQAKKSNIKKVLQNYKIFLKGAHESFKNILSEPKASQTLTSDKILMREVSTTLMALFQPYEKDMRDYVIADIFTDLYRNATRVPTLAIALKKLLNPGKFNCLPVDVRCLIPKLNQFNPTLFECCCYLNNAAVLQEIIKNQPLTKDFDRPLEYLKMLAAADFSDTPAKESSHSKKKDNVFLFLKIIMSTIIDTSKVINESENARENWKRLKKYCLKNIEVLTHELNRRKLQENLLKQDSKAYIFSDIIVQSYALQKECTYQDISTDHNNN